MLLEELVVTSGKGGWRLCRITCPGFHMIDEVNLFNEDADNILTQKEDRLVIEGPSHSAVLVLEKAGEDLVDKGVMIRLVELGRGIQKRKQFFQVQLAVVMKYLMLHWV